MTTASILLVEDEPKVAAFIVQGLAEEGYPLVWISNGEEALGYAATHPLALVILDVRLPGLSGLEVCRRLRLHTPMVPILMLTALDAVADRVAGFRAGADDYLAKPFHFEELVVRIEALLRRATARHLQASLVDHHLVLDPVAQTCTYQGHPIPLTQTEFSLLAYFMARPDQALHRDDIHRDVWGYNFERGTNLIDVYVGYVRRRLQEAGCPVQIETIRGVGYRYHASTAAAANTGQAHG